MLRIYNSLSREKQRFTPIEAGKVRMYVCGITVYDYCHIGHARMLVVFDMVYRYLRAQGYAVTYVRNITDIDDKIIRRAQENGEAYTALTARFIAAMHADAEALQMLKPDYEPKATENIPAILAMIETLIKKGHAYLATSGDVYYAVNSFQSYGCLSGKKREDLRAGARVEVAEQKNDPLDFVLWKAGKPGEPTWDSPWGPGRPGWHIECSAMSSALLGAHFDIHGGGQDLQFPHHENEIAQSEACHGEKFVNYWLHNGFVRINEEKMSKSLGNFFTIRDVLQHYKGEELRYLLLSSHYRSPLNYSETQLETAKAALTRLYTALRDLSSATPDATVGCEYRERFINAMNDDFNTPEALAVLFDIAHVINREKERQTTQAAKLGTVLRELAGILGFLNHDPEAYLQASGNSALGDAAIEAMLAERTAARAARDWAASDRIRDQLVEQGVILEDSADGTRWRRA